MAKLNITYRNFCKRTTKNEFSKIWGTLSDNNIVFLFYVNQFAHYCQISLPQSFPSLFSLHFCFPDCCVLRTPAILPKHSHTVKLSLHFMLILGACPKSSHPPLCKHRWMTGLVHCNQKKREAITLCFLS